MKLKYYLRGLGIGIIVTAVIMGIGSGKETLSDREIMERAAALGMVETSTPGNSLADLVIEPSSEPAAVPTEEPADTPSPEPTPAITPTSEPTPEPTITPTAEPTLAPEPLPTQAPSPEPADLPSAEPTDIPDGLPGKDVTIVVSSGESSYAICQKLESEGLIPSASDFDTYLYSNGYDRKLRTGSFVIPSGSGQEEIAEILTGGL